MKFPTNVSFRVNSKSEYNEFVRGLEGWVQTLQERGEDAASFAAILQRIRYHDDEGIIEEIPDAYVEVSGKRISAGEFPAMLQLFQQEVAGHKATVVLFERDQMNYKAVQMRRSALR